MQKEQSKKLSSGVVFLQKIDESKISFSRQLRRGMTAAEKILWERLRNSQVGKKFRRQQIIEGFIVDFFCNTAKLVIEVDGNIHDNPEQVAEDLHRKNIFKNRGLSEIRFRNEEILEDIDIVIEKISNCVKQRTIGI